MYNIKARKVSSCEDDTLPPEPSEPRPEEDHSEILDGVQDSNKDKEDYNEKSKEDMGSLYAPREATSELNTEPSNEDVESMESPSEDPCKFLTILPRELRDKVCILLQFSVYVPTI